MIRARRLLAGMLLAAPLAHAQDAELPPDAPPAPAPKPNLFTGFAIHGAEDFRLRYWAVDQDVPNNEGVEHVLDYVEAVDRLDLSAGTQAWTASARVDAVGLFANRYQLDGVLVHERDLLGEGLTFPLDDGYANVEKAALEARGARGAAAIGDSYVSFGRGLALNLVKNTELDVDTSLRGARGVLHAGNWDLTAATGWTNPQQIALENPNVGLTAGLRHAVHGVRVDRYGLGPLNVGAHGVVVQWQRAWDPEALPWAAYTGSPDAWVAGGTVEALGVAGLDLFVEGDVYGYRAEEIPVTSGHALYASVAAYPGRASVLVEARRSKNAEYLNSFSKNYEIAAGPTLEYERVITEDSSAAVNSNDVTGGRVRVDVRLGEGETTFLPYLSLAGFRDADTGSLHFNRTPESIGHAVAGVQWLKGDVHLLLNAGARADVRDKGADGTDYGADRMVHADVELVFPIAGPVSLDLTPSVLVYGWGVNPVQQEDYTDFSGVVAVKVGAPWSLIFYTDYSDNPLIRTTGNLSDDVYGAVELQWMPGPATTLKAFYGAYREGIRCAGGQCRKLPGFEGAKLALTTSF